MKEYALSVCTKTYRGLQTKPSLRAGRMCGLGAMPVVRRKFLETPLEEAKIAPLTLVILTKK